MIPAFRATFETLTYEEVDIVWGEYLIWKKEDKPYGLNLNGPEFFQYCVSNNIQTHDLLRPLKMLHRPLLLRLLRI